MPNRVMVKPHVELVSIRSLRKGRKPHAMGSCMLANVTLKSDGLEGDLLDEWTECREPGPEALKVLKRVIHTDNGFVYQDDWEAYASAVYYAASNAQDEPELPAFLTGCRFRAAYVCGPEFYVSG